MEFRAWVCTHGKAGEIGGRAEVNERRKERQLPSRGRDAMRLAMSLPAKLAIQAGLPREFGVNPGAGLTQSHLFRQPILVSHKHGTIDFHSQRSMLAAFHDLDDRIHGDRDLYTCRI